MSLSYRFDEESLLDIEHAAASYDEKVPGLGGQFIDEVLHVIGLIADFPKGHPVVHQTQYPLRRALLNQFPHFIAYELRDDEIVVVGVMPQRQNPRRLLRRIGEV